MTFLDQLIGKYYASGSDDYLKEDKPLKYVTADNGPFEIRHNRLGTFTNKIKKIPDLQEMAPSIVLNIPKIPFHIFNQMIAWFRLIYKNEKTEATFMIFYNEGSDTFIPFIPTQKNSGANSHYQRDEDKDYRRLSQDHILVMVAHSHPWRGNSRPGPSGTDNNDEKEAILYLIANNVEGVPNVYCSSCPGGERVDLDFFSIFENPFLQREDIPKDIIHLLEKSLTEKEVFAQYLDVDSFNVPKSWLKKAARKTIDELPAKSKVNIPGWQQTDSFGRSKNKKYRGTGSVHSSYSQVLSGEEEEMRKKIEDYYNSLEEDDDFYRQYPYARPEADMRTKPSEDDLCSGVERIDLFDLIDQLLDLDQDDKMDVILSVIMDEDKELAYKIQDIWQSSASEKEADDQAIEEALNGYTG